MLKNLLKVVGIGAGVVALLEVGGIIGEGQMAAALEVNGDEITPKEFFDNIDAGESEEVLKRHPYKRFKIKAVEDIYRTLSKAYRGY